MANSEYTRKGYPNTILQTVVPNVPTTVYTAGGATCHLTTITICNLLNAAGTFSLGIALKGDAINQLKQFIYKDIDFIAKDVLACDLELGLKQGDSIFMSAGAANQFAVTVQGSEEGYNGVNI